MKIACINCITALLKLCRAEVFDEYVQPAEIEINTSNGDLVMAGWQRTEALVYNDSSQLRKATVTLFGQRNCRFATLLWVAY